LKPNLGHYKLNKLQSIHIETYYSEALKTGHRLNKGGLSKQTVLHHHRVLREALNKAVKWQFLVRKGRREYRPFKSMPTDCMNHQKYYNMSSSAKVLLWEFCYQYNGYNNGNLCAAFSVLKKRGWKSKGTLNRALKELRKLEWITVSRQGGKNLCSLYALTFQAIDDCNDKLEIKPTTTALGDWKN